MHPNFFLTLLANCAKFMLRQLLYFRLLEAQEP